jgi:hypothetical protein
MTILRDVPLHETMGHRGLYTEPQELPCILVRHTIHNHTVVKHVKLPPSGSFHSHEFPSETEYQHHSCNL